MVRQGPIRRRQRINNFGNLGRAGAVRPSAADEERLLRGMPSGDHDTDGHHVEWPQSLVGAHVLVAST